MGSITSYVDATDDLREVVARASTAAEYAIDTEFHRERTYFPQVALVQLAFNDEVHLIDPLAVDLVELRPLLDGDGTCIMHAASQDLEVLQLACGTIPTRLLDTQIAASFCGYSSASLGSLMKAYLGVDLPKASRLTDWLARPLTDDQLGYAAADVDRLIELADLIRADLATTGRVEWAIDECQLLRDNPPGRRTPEEAVFKIRETRSLKGRALRVAADVAAWRERKAATVDVPVRQVLPDIAVATIGQRAPTTVAQLRSLRGMDSRPLSNANAAEVIEVVASAREGDPVVRPAPQSPELGKELRPAVSLITAWVAQCARDMRLDPAMLATRSDIEQLLANDSGRLSAGWRAEVAGDAIRRLVDGSAALAFDGGRLVLEARLTLAVADMNG